MFFFGRASAGAFHASRCFSSSGLIASSVVSPTISSVALSGRIQRLVERLEIRARERRDARLLPAARERIRVRVALPVDELREQAHGNALRLRLLLLNARERLRLQALEVRLREGRD